MSVAPQSTPIGGAVDHGDWTRDEWLAFADRLLAGAQAWASPGNARITPPGREGGYGRDVDGLEGFARTFLLAGFRIAGERGQGVDELIDFYTRGIRTGVDPDAADRWVRLDEHPQAKVEAASIALILDLTREWIWDRLDETTRTRVIEYFSPAVGDDSYPRTNWLWFRLVVQTFLRSVGGPWSESDVAADLALHDSFARADGWLSDGDERSYDHYVGWALHLYPVLWSRMQGAADLAGGRTATDIVALDRFLLDAVELVGADGSPLIEGRSLIYRFAAAAPFWIGVLAEVPSVSAGRLRHAADRIVRHFAERGVPDADDLLTMGWHDEWRLLAQSYSGPASPYWASKGLLGIMLPADHPVWAAPSEPLPVESADTLTVVRAPGWIIAGTRDDGIVRVVNHGTDHAAAGSLVGDSPLYARLGYSTATSPMLDKAGWESPLEQSVAVIDGLGRASHRAAMETLEVSVRDGGGAPVAIGASTSIAHWITPNPHQVRHGSGIEGVVQLAGRLDIVSLVRGPWELRIATLETIESGAEPVAIRIGGWAVAGDEPASTSGEHGVVATAAGVTSRIHDLSGGGRPGVVLRSGAGPLGSRYATPVLEYPVESGARVVAIIELAGTPRHDLAVTRLEISGEDGIPRFDVTWPDGLETTSTLTDSRHAEVANR